jgi:hypothetical protein
MSLSLSNRFCLALVINLNDDDDTKDARPAANRHKNNNNNKDDVVWWPAWLFDNYHQLSSMCSRLGLTGHHFQEYLEESKLDPTILERKVAYLIGDPIPGHRRTIYNPQTRLMDVANNDIVEQGARYPGWLKACADGSRRSDAVVPVLPTIKPAPTKAKKKRPAKFTSKRQRRASLAATSKKKKTYYGTGDSDACSSKILKSNSKTGQYKSATSSKKQDVAAKKQKNTSKATFANTQNLTPRQKKIMNGESESEEEKNFYRFSHLWPNVLQKEGWKLIRPKKNLRLDSWWYVLPGSSAQNGILGVDYFNTTEGVIQYCKEKNYYATYGHSMMPDVLVGGMPSQPTPAANKQLHQRLQSQSKPVQDDDHHHDENQTQNTSNLERVVTPCTAVSRTDGTALGAAVSTIGEHIIVSAKNEDDSDESEYLI